MRFVVDRPDFGPAIARLALEERQKIDHVLQAVGIDTVTYLRSLTDEMRPPVGARAGVRTGRRQAGFIGPLEGAAASTLGQRTRKGRLRKDGTRGPRTGKREVGRQAHPGHWADVTGQLALSYAFTVVTTPKGAMLTISNSAEYAAALEARDGYFVLSGVMEDGGPVEQAIRRAAAALAPGWIIRRAA
jgi:hypothetical protein